MKKFLMTLVVLASASPAFAVTVAQWSSTPIVSGDKTFTLGSSSGLGDAQVDVNVVDNGLLHSLNLSGLSNTSNNFTLTFTVSVNSGNNTIKTTRVSQNDVLGNATGGSTTTTNPGSFSDTLNGTQAGTARNQAAGVTSVTFATTSFGVNGSNFLSNITYDLIQQAGPAVPEPSTFVLCGLGVVGLVAARRRR